MLPDGITGFRVECEREPPPGGLSGSLAPPRHLNLSWVEWSSAPPQGVQVGATYVSFNAFTFVGQAYENTVDVSTGVSEAPTA